MEHSFVLLASCHHHQSNPPLHEAHEMHILHAQVSCTLDQEMAGFE